MDSWINTYANKQQLNNLDFPEQFLVKFFHDKKFIGNSIKKRLSILDIGCGYGRNIRLFQKFSTDILCIDPVPHAVKFVSESYNVDARLFNPPNLTIDQKFDVIVACNSIYYLTDNMDFQSFFEQILTNLNSGGNIIFSLLGHQHSILKGGEYVEDGVYRLNNNEAKFNDRQGQLIFLPQDDFIIENFGLNILSKGEIIDNFDSSVRHLKVFMAQLNDI
jgi:SAM-dependent methyltransferase